MLDLCSLALTCDTFLPSAAISSCTITTRKQGSALSGPTAVQFPSPTDELVSLKGFHPCALIGRLSDQCVPHWNPPTPAASRGSASEEALLATRCKKGRRENLQLGPKLCRTKASSRRPKLAAERKPAPGGHEQGGSWQCRNGGKVKA